MKITIEYIGRPSKKPSVILQKGVMSKKQFLRFLSKNMGDEVLLTRTEFKAPIVFHEGFAEVQGERETKMELISEINIKRLSL